MTQPNLDLSGLLDALREKEIDDPVREFIRFLYQELIEVDSTEHVQAQRHERSLARTAQRNGTRMKTLTTKSGDVDLAIPKLRKGSYFPSFLVKRRRIDQALHAVVAEAYVEGVSTRRVDDLFEALGADSGISKSEVSRICATLDKDLEAFRTRELSHHAFPYLVLDATYVKARVNRRVVSRAVVVAMGVGADGRREILGIAIGDSEDAVFWGEFLMSLKERGLSGVQLVISDSHAGLTAAINRYFSGAAWQRCRVHFKRNVLAKVPRTQASMVSAIISTIFAQPDAEHVEDQVKEVATMLKKSFPEVSEILLDAAEDITAFRHFPQAHWKKLWSSNAIERLNAGIKQRTRVVGIFPNDAAALRLITAVCVDEHDEWLATERRYMSQESMELLSDAPASITPIALATNE